MRNRVLLAALVPLLVGGCAPSFYLYGAPCGGLMQRSAYHRTSVMATTQRVQALQSRLALTPVRMDRTAVSSGECR
jgi:hypothetical protein